MTYDEAKKQLGSPKTGRDRGNGLVLNVEQIEKNIRKAFGGDPYESGQRDSRNGETIQWGDNWVKEMKKLYPMQWKQYCKGHDDWTSKHDQN